MTLETADTVVRETPVVTAIALGSVHLLVVFVYGVVTGTLPTDGGVSDVPRLAVTAQLVVGSLSAVALIAVPVWGYLTARLILPLLVVPVLAVSLLVVSPLSVYVALLPGAVSVVSVAAVAEYVLRGLLKGRLGWTDPVLVAVSVGVVHLVVVGVVSGRLLRVNSFTEVAFVLPGLVTVVAGVGWLVLRFELLVPLVVFPFAVTFLVVGLATDGELLETYVRSAGGVYVITLAAGTAEYLVT